MKCVLTHLVFWDGGDTEKRIYIVVQFMKYHKYAAHYVIFNRWNNVIILKIVISNTTNNVRIKMEGEEEIQIYVP